MKEGLIFQKPPKIETLKGAQDVHSVLSTFINPTETDLEIFALLEDEVTELEEAMKTGNRELIGNELADVILFTIQIGSYYGITIEDVVSRKINRNFYKYNPVDLKRLMEEEGLSTKEAKLKLKAEWDTSQDHEFFKNI